MSGFRLIGKSADSITAELRSWEGPVSAGRQGRHVWTRVTFPIDQGEVYSLGQRHARGDCATVSQSVSYWKQLEKRLKWRLVELAA